uniref:Uncharacterized protein n=1 Tax=Panagrolaimus sp. PS1159 TaxID=55785 RepID=A0AC35GXV6_9BILA
MHFELSNLEGMEKVVEILKLLVKMMIKNLFLVKMIALEIATIVEVKAEKVVAAAAVVVGNLSLLQGFEH